MVSVFVPILYLAVLIGGLSTFSYFYRRRKPVPVSQLDAWFPPNTARDVYFSLLAAQETVPDGLLKAALLVRAVEDIKRLQTLQIRKQALNNLMQRGGAGDDLLVRFTQLEEEMKAEVMDVASEAQALQDGWNQIIFQTANEMYLNDLHRQKLAKIMEDAKRVREEVEREGDAGRVRMEAVVKAGAARSARERKEAEERKARDAKEAEEARERAAQELIAMEEREKEKAAAAAASAGGNGSGGGHGTPGGKGAGHKGGSSPANKRKNK